MMNLNPRQMEKMMKRMGVQTTQIDAEEVVIKKSDGELVIRDPQVTKVNMMGQETYQVVGTAEEKESESITSEDAGLVAEKAGVSVEEAQKALDEEGDIAAAILKLKNR